MLLADLRGAQWSLLRGEGPTPWLDHLDPTAQAGLGTSPVQVLDFLVQGELLRALDRGNPGPREAVGRALAWARRLPSSERSLFLGLGVRIRLTELALQPGHPQVLRQAQEALADFQRTFPQDAEGPALKQILEGLQQPPSQRPNLPVALKDDALSAVLLRR